MNFSEIKAAFQRLFSAIEFRIFVFILFVGVFIYPFFGFKNLVDPWQVYSYFIFAWLTLIGLLFLMSLVDDNSEDTGQFDP